MPSETIHIRYHTDSNITTLHSHEVFVYGSNEAGKHHGGAARCAWEKFGAKYGHGKGHMGQSYAIPTMTAHFQPLPLTKIKHYVQQFTRYAQKHPEKTFLLTEIGVGIAGFPVCEVASLFLSAARLKNVVLPYAFAECLVTTKGGHFAPDS